MPKKNSTSRDRTTAIGRDLETVHRFATDLLAQHKLSDWSVFWENSTESSDGGGATYCHARRIIFSAAYLAILSPAERRESVRHEVAHAIVGVAAEHSEEWRAKAIELGGSGKAAHEVNGLLYPWIGLCPDEHPFVSIDPPGRTGFVCNEHDEPVAVERWKKNTRSHAFDPGVQKIVNAYSEPASVPEFGVGDVVYVIPYGSEQFDNAPLTILEVTERYYATRHVDTGEQHKVRHEMVAAAPVP